ncbi:MAG: hypothetical protein H5T86_03150 [Armatimonadetes bacterium]|nr:hypothetical protein [Armatimonadota bacterium]
MMSEEVLLVNRAPVLTLWAAVVAERLGFDEDEALSLGRAVAGLNAQAKGRSLGIFKPVERATEAKKAAEQKPQELLWVKLCGRMVPAKMTDKGLRAVIKGQPVDAESTRRYLEGKFGHKLDAVREAMTQLAAAYTPEELAERAFELYERFRPEIPPGRAGWGSKGALNLALIRHMAAEAAR